MTSVLDGITYDSELTIGDHMWSKILLIKFLLGHFLNEMIREHLQTDILFIYYTIMWKAENFFFIN